MYSVSQDYIDIMQGGNSINRRITGYLGNIAFSGDDILTGSFSYSGKIVHSTDVKLGGVFIQTIKFSFLKSFSSSISRGSWKGRTITVSIGLLVDADEGTYEDVPLGVFTIDDAMHSAVGVDITAYCNMSKFDTTSGMASSMTGTLYEIASLACSNCGVHMGMTEQEFAELPNGTGVFSPYIPNDIENWHDIISWIAVTICGYATMNRQGNLVFKTWDDTSIMNISQDVRFEGGLYSDFSTYYTGISVVNMKNETTEYMGMPVDNGLTMNLGSNPFLQYGTDEVRTARKYAILEALQKFNYVPFKVSTYLDPAFDLGDVFTFTGGRASNSKVCVMSIEYSFANGLKMAGYGNDPALANARSKVDKNIAGLLSQTDGKTIRYYTYVNPNNITGIEQETQIGAISFATVEETTVTIWSEIQLDCTLDDADDPMQVIVHYYLNGVEEAYTPIQTIGNDGIYTLDYNYFLTGIGGGLRNDWVVKLECIGGEADIAQNGVHICLEGQGLVGEDAFTGLIEVSEEMPLWIVNAIAVGAFTETVDASTPANIPETISDNISILDIGEKYVEDYILDQNGDHILDQNGDSILGANEIQTSVVNSPDLTESVIIKLEIDESLVMRCGDEFYVGEDMSTGLYNTLYEGGT